MSDAAKVLGPVSIEAVVHLVNPETGDTGKVTYGFSVGREVTAKDIERALRGSAEAAREHGMALMAPDTFFNHVLVKEKTGRVGNSATPSEFNYDAFGIDTADAPRRHDDVLDDDDE